MALTDDNSVLILGAGVSAPFGLPMGSELIDTIAKNLNGQLIEYSLGRCSVFDLLNKITPLNDINNFQRFPYLHALLWKMGIVRADLGLNLSGEALQKKLEEQLAVMAALARLMGNQTSDSIDDFIVMNKSYADYVKICIAAEFIQALYNKRSLVGIDGRYLDYLDDIQKKIADPKTGEKKKKEPERNWIHRLINLIRLGVQEGWVAENNKVKIITFNYDTILECVLEQQFSNTEKLNDQGGRYQDYIDIIHVHGQCGKLKNELAIPSKTCWEWAQGIHVIREDEEKLKPEIKKERERARDWIKSATDIYACGFAFAKANTDLIGLSNRPKNKTRRIYYSNYSDDIGLRNAVEKFNGYLTTITEEKNIGVSDWIGVGTLGELP